ncbi:hypothetical protein B296_00000968 [Ensete ventricosum]|uniref:Uncharacterized protein n=1 Tax=Ensete ventricosum TaxID=4639 RepID=A0A427B1H5_ENSVE|nr:hypothetical protein B296_00000968 [Ensete ventricosum]
MIRRSWRESVILGVGNHDEEAVCYGNAGGASDDVVLLRELVSRERVVRGHMAVAVAGSDLEAGVCSERVVALLVRAVVCDEWVAHIHDEAAARMVEEGIHNKAALSSASLVVLVFHGAAAGGSAAAVELIRRSIKLLLYRPSSSSCLSSPFQRDGVVTGARATTTSGTVPLRGRRLKHGVQPKKDSNNTRARTLSLSLHRLTSTFVAHRPVREVAALGDGDGDLGLDSGILRRGRQHYSTEADGVTAESLHRRAAPPGTTTLASLVAAPHGVTTSNATLSTSTRPHSPAPSAISIPAMPATASNARRQRRFIAVFISSCSPRFCTLHGELGAGLYMESEARSGGSLDSLSAS